MSTKENRRKEFEEKKANLTRAMKWKLEQDGAAFEKALWSEGGFILLGYISDKALEHFFDLIAAEQDRRDEAKGAKP